MNKKIRFIGFVLFILIGILIRFLTITKVPLFDDQAWFLSIRHFDNFGFNLFSNVHPPLGLWITILTSLLTKQIFGIRLMYLIINFLNLLLIFKFVKEAYNKDIAKKALFIFLITFYPFIIAISSDSDGSIMVLLTSLLFYAIYKYFKTERFYWLFFAGVYFGLASLTKIRSSMLAFSFLPVFFLFKIKKWKKDILFLFLINFLIFCIFPLFLYLGYPRIWKEVFFDVLLFTTTKFEILSKLAHPLLFLNLATALTPLFLGLLLLTLIKRKNRSDWFFLSWFLPLFVIFICFIPTRFTLDLPRMLAILLTPICILSASALANLRFRYLLKSSISAIFFGASLYIWNNYGVSDYWYYMLASSPVIKINPLIMGIIFPVAGLCFIMGFRSVLSKKGASPFFIMFLILSLSFNFLLIAEVLTDKTAANLITDFQEFARNNIVQIPIFSWNEEIPGYLGEPHLNLKLVKAPYLQEYMKKIGFNETGYVDLDQDNSKIEPLLKNGGTVFLYNLPYEYTVEKSLANQEKIKLINKYCSKVREFKYLRATGEIYHC